MGLFGNFSIPNDPGIPDYMPGINDALAANAALGKKKKHGGFGGFLKAWAGHWGDAVTGNPVYANSMARQQQAELEDQSYQHHRQDDLSDYETHKKIDQQYAQPDVPGLINEFMTAKQLRLVPEGTSYEDYLRLKFPQQFAPPAPVTMQHGATIEGGTDTGTPTATGPNGQKIQFNPQTGQWEPVGGAGGNASGGFPQ